MSSYCFSHLCGIEVFIPRPSFLGLVNLCHMSDLWCPTFCTLYSSFVRIRSSMLCAWVHLQHVSLLLAGESKRIPHWVNEALIYIILGFVS